MSTESTSMNAASRAPSAPSSLWDRLSTWASENRTIVYTVAGTVVVITGAGVLYSLSGSTKPRNDSPGSVEKRKNKKDKRKGKKASEGEKTATPEAKDEEAVPRAAVQEVDEELPEINETTVDTLSQDDRNSYAVKLKAAGNKAYGSKDYNEAIELYGKAILCRPDPVYFSNRAACYNALSDWDKVVEDTSAAIAMDPEYVKALNRRAHAYEHQDWLSEALLDYTASCIIDGFKNVHSQQSVERLLRKVAEKKGKVVLEAKGSKLPSPSFVTNYLQSFRPQPPPAGLGPEVELDENSGKAQLQKGLAALQQRSGEGYRNADQSFEKAIELNDLGEHEAFGLNMRATFRYLKGDTTQALEDLGQSIKSNPSLTQSFIKRASIHLEMNERDAAADDFEQATAQNKDDPDIFYHRAQLHFILGEFPDAAKDYQKSIDLDPAFIYSHIQLGVTQYKMGSVVSSMSTFRRTIKKFDKTPDVYNYYGELLLDQSKYEEAVAKFETALDMDKQNKPATINVLPLVNKGLAVFQWKQDFEEAENLCQKALKIDPECDIAVATLAQLLLQQGKITEALEYFQRAAELSRTEGEVVNALSYAEAARTQMEVAQKYPQLAQRLQQMAAAGPGMPVR